MSSPVPPRVRIVQVREYVGASGVNYFKGYLGDCLLIMRRADRAPLTAGEIARLDVFAEPAPIKGAPPAKGQPLTTLPPSITAPRRR